MTTSPEASRLLGLLEGLKGLRLAVEALREQEESKQSWVPIEHKLTTLSLAEASALSGISRNRLRQTIFDGKLQAQIIGRGYRMKRTDLEDYVDSL